MATLYVIPNWEKDFENSKSRTVERATWFPVQNHFDGKRMRRLQKLKNSVELYGAFHAIVAIASKCTFRGVLMDDHGPINAMDLEDKTGFPSKTFDRAFKELSSPLIGLLEKHEMEEIDGKWTLPEAVGTWAVSQGQRRTLKAAGVPKGTRGAPNGHEGKPPIPQVPPKATAPQIPPHPAASPEIPTQPPKAAEISERPKKGMEGNGTEGKVPSAVSQGETASATSGGSPPSHANLIADPEIAKKMICEKILGGKDPSRAWSYDALERLSKLLPIPLDEIMDIAWFRALPKTDDVPELKNRRDPVTETGLMNYWGDELSRAREFKKKWRGSQRNGASKPEPAHWREVFHWLHGPNIRLPATFAELERDQVEEFERNVQAFGNRDAADRCGDPALL